MDFVPLLKGNRLVPKRVAKTVTFDLCLDPIDVAEDVPTWCVLQKQDNKRNVAIVVSASVSAAMADWNKLTSVADVVAAFEMRSAMHFRRFSLQNYAQTELAWGLALMSLGRTEEGQAHLQEFCAQYDIAANDPVLMSAITETQHLGSSARSPSSI